MMMLRSSSASPFVRKVRIAAAVLGSCRSHRGRSRRHLRPDRHAARAEPARQNPDAGPGGRPGDLRQRGHPRISRFSRRRRQDHPDRRGALRRADPRRARRRRDRRRHSQGLRDALARGRRPQRALARTPDRQDRPRPGRARSHARRPDRVDVASIALACALGYLDLRFAGAWRAERPKLVAWLDAFAADVPAFEATRHREG